MRYNELYQDALEKLLDRLVPDAGDHVSMATLQEAMRNEIGRHASLSILRPMIGALCSYGEITYVRGIVTRL